MKWFNTHLEDNSCLFQCCVCKWFGTYALCKCKNEYIYIILHGPIKLSLSIYMYMILHGYVNTKKCKKCDFYLRRGEFIMFWMISQLNGPLQKKKKKNYQNIHPQLIHMTFF
jgi:hypothetical protein